MGRDRRVERDLMIVPMRITFLGVVATVMEGRVSGVGKTFAPNDIGQRTPTGAGIEEVCAPHE